MSSTEKESSTTPIKDEVAAHLKGLRLEQAIQPSIDSNLRKVVSTHPRWYMRWLYGLIGFATQLTTPKPKSPDSGKKKSWLDRRAERFNARQQAAQSGDHPEDYTLY